MSVSERAMPPLMAEPPMSNEMIIATLPFLWFVVSARTVGGELQAFIPPPAMRLWRERE
jgi:hypothetical protein